MAPADWVVPGSVLLTSRLGGEGLGLWDKEPATALAAAGDLGVRHRRVCQRDGAGYAELEQSVGSELSSLPSAAPSGWVTTDLIWIRRTAWVDCPG